MEWQWSSMNCTQKIRSSVVMPPVIERLERGEVNGAVQTV